MLEISFTPYVGTSSGTSTVQMNGLGVCPPGHYGPAIMLPGASVPAVVADTAATARQAWNPYATESKLSGLGVSGIRWDLLALSFGAAFAGIIGYTWYRSRKGVK